MVENQQTGLLWERYEMQKKYKLTAYFPAKKDLEECLYFTIESYDINLLIEAMIGREHLRFTLEEI